MTQQTELPTRPFTRLPCLLSFSFSSSFLFHLLFFTSSSPLHPLFFSPFPLLQLSLLDSLAASSRTQCPSLNLAGKSSSFCSLGLQRGTGYNISVSYCYPDSLIVDMWLVFTHFFLSLFCFFLLHTLRSSQIAIADTL